MAFTLSVLPFVYTAKYDGSWTETLHERPHKTPAEEAGLNTEEATALLAERNSIPGLPLVNYTSQYGMGCFEGLKAFPQKNGGLKLFRPDQNAARFARSMEGLRMPPFPEDLFVKGAIDSTAKNADIGFAPTYDPAWEENDFASAHAIYLRPFTWSEPAIGLGLSSAPWVVIASTLVGAYFREGNHKAVTTTRVRATPGGTGWIKCDANYVIPILAKKEAEADGYMESIFLDAKEGRFVEEGSSCNIFFLLEDDTLVTPALEDTILPGITRRSVMTLAEDRGLVVEERRITIEEVLDSAKECFVTGTAAGVNYVESITHNGRTAVFSGGTIGPVSRDLQVTLKGIQYGTVEDKHGWMTPV